MNIRNEIQASIVEVESKRPVLKEFLGCVSDTLEVTEDWVLESYVENNVGLWGMINLLAYNSVALSVEHSQTFIDSVLELAKSDFASDAKTAL